MANEENLRSFGTEGAYEPTREDRQKGQKASVEARKYNKNIRRALQALMMGQYGVNNDGEPITGAEAFALTALSKAIGGDSDWGRIVRDTVGEKPTDKTEIEQKTVRIRLTRHSAEETEKEPDDDDEC